MPTIDRPCFVIVGGINGSGKSTFAKSAAGTPLLLEQTAINPDDLTNAAKTEYGLGDATGANLIGVEQAEKAVWRAIAEGTSVAVETVLSSDKFMRCVRAARLRDFRTRLIFVGLPTVELALERIRARVAAGGHGVPEQKVRDRWIRAHDNLAAFLPLVDDVLVFSNVAEPFCVAERVGRRGTLRVQDRDALPMVTKCLRGSAD